MSDAVTRLFLDLLFHAPLTIKLNNTLVHSLSRCQVRNFFIKVLIAMTLLNNVMTVVVRLLK